MNKKPFPNRPRMPSVAIVTIFIVYARGLFNELVCGKTCPSVSTSFDSRVVSFFFSVTVYPDPLPFLPTYLKRLCEYRKIMKYRVQLGKRILLFSSCYKVLVEFMYEVHSMVQSINTGTECI